MSKNIYLQIIIIYNRWKFILKRLLLIINYVIEKVRLYEKWQVEQVDCFLSIFVINMPLKNECIFNRSFGAKWSINIFFSFNYYSNKFEVRARRYPALNAYMYECNESLKYQPKISFNYVKTAERKCDCVFWSWKKNR
jgi:hypothetical protein